MEVRTKLELKDFDKDDPESIRLLDLTREFIERLNNYVADFDESITILKENREENIKKEDKDKIADIDESIQFVESKINDVSNEMRKIAEEMSFFVELKEKAAVDEEEKPAKISPVKKKSGKKKTSKKKSAKKEKN